MLRKLFTVAVLAVSGLGGLLTTGCSSESPKPYSLTGDQNATVPDRQNPRYLDDKGHYRPEFPPR